MESSKTVALLSASTLVLGGLAIYNLLSGIKATRERERQNRMEELMLQHEVNSRKDV